MIVEIADRIRLNLSPIESFFSTLCGMSKSVTTSYFSGNKGKYDIVPVPYNDDDISNCKINQSLSLIPKEKGIKAIGYFEEGKSVNLINKKDNIYECGLIFVCWYNSKFFSGGDVNSLLSAKVLSLLNKKINSGEMFEFIKIESLSMVSVEDSMSIFKKYTILMDKQNLLFNPYGFFSISIDLTFSINYGCLAQLTVNEQQCV